MRAAPPVDFPLARQGVWAGSAAVLAGLAAAVPAVWLAWQLHAQRASSPVIDLALAVIGFAATLAAARRGARVAGAGHGGRLRWDGTAWSHLDRAGLAERLGAPAVRIDLGVALLARAPQPGRRARWLALQRRDDPAAWHGLRVALAQRSRPGDPSVAPVGGSP